MLAPGLAAGSPAATELLCKLVLAAAPAGSGGGNVDAFAAQWLLAKLSGLGRTQKAQRGKLPGERCGRGMLR